MTGLFNILVAEDEELERNMITETLKKIMDDETNYEMTIFEARDGLEAVQIIRNNHLKAAFLDVRMPGINGLQVAEEIQHTNNHTLFTFISAYGEYPILRSALKLEACDYLLKPARKRDIINAFWKMVDPDKNFIEVTSSSLTTLEPVVNSSAATNKANTTTKELISAAKSYVRQNLKQKLTLEEVAGFVGFSASYFSAIFSKAENLTYKEYLIKVRINHAKKMLREGSMPLKNVARETGFKDPNYFSKVFTRNVGVTPSRYRELEGNTNDFEYLSNNFKGVTAR